MKIKFPKHVWDIIMDYAREYDLKPSEAAIEIIAQYTQD